MGFIWQLCWPMFFYGIMIDLVSIFLKQRGALACTSVGAALSLPILLWQYQKTKNEGKSKQESDCRRNFTGREGIFCIMAGIIACIAVNTLIMISPASALSQGFSESAEELYGPSVFWQVVAMGGIVPAAEELIFRGHIFTKLRKKCSFGQAAFLSSVLFGVYHGNVLQGIYGFIMGMMFAWTMEKKKIIAGPFFMHMAANVTSVAITASGMTVGF